MPRRQTLEEIAASSGRSSPSGRSVAPFSLLLLAYAIIRRGGTAGGPKDPKKFLPFNAADINPETFATLAREIISEDEDLFIDTEAGEPTFFVRVSSPSDVAQGGMLFHSAHYLDGLVLLNNINRAHVSNWTSRGWAQALGKVPFAYHDGVIGSASAYSVSSHGVAVTREFFQLDSASRRAPPKRY